MSDQRPPSNPAGQHPTLTPAAPHRPQPVIPHGAPAPRMQPQSIRQGIVPMQTAKPTDAELEPLALVEDDMVEEMPASIAPANKSKIRAFGPDLTRKDHNWKRAPYKDGKGAIRVKTFHGKYSDQGMEHIDDVINEWLDEHPEVEVKFVTSTVNVFEGKIREPALVLNLWY